eukprot:gnl/TRDRNA2_/TRDRNA2_203564_c0_seq1.p1 gnl/TRDRNA2_/TRDRNA2_203564_c0~~gnl/TRDRNA2_/TRDRNA2_203564_c0_seq1.p1  ORF type:complete len:664 (+),score=112.94 gnl/TRDRNA2_/TRDRNA2_203564_c0_seq1:59-2050(+)
MAEVVDRNSLENLLQRLSGGRTKKVEILAAALRERGLITGSHFLESTASASARQVLQLELSKQLEIPSSFVSSLRLAVEESRLSFGGFPGPPPQTEFSILFTAPHTLHLARDGHKDHLPETHTGLLAKSFAEKVQGAYLTWTAQEVARIRELKRPDPTNKDPNYTHRDDLAESPWTRNLREVRHLFRHQYACLHVDLHGCKDPTPDGGSHLVVGLRAMELAKRPGVEEFREVLLDYLRVVLRGISVNACPQRQLTGAVDEDRYTLTQQSLTELGGSWVTAVQLEMSRSLRKRLSSDTELRTLMAQAIQFAWLVACRESHVPKKEWQSLPRGLEKFLNRSNRLYKRRAAMYGGETLIPGPKARKEEAEASPPESPCSSPPESPTFGKSTLFEDDDDDAKEAEATANNEPEVPPSQEPIEDIEKRLRSEAAELAWRLGGNTVSSTASGARCTSATMPRAQGVQYRDLIDWLKLNFSGETNLGLPPDKATAAVPRAQLATPNVPPADALDAIPRQPSCRSEPLSLHLVGNHTSWSDQGPMLWDGHGFVTTIVVGAGQGPDDRNWTSFQILQSGRWDRCYHPDINDANPFVEWQLRGPDSKGTGLNWSIGQPHGSVNSPARNAAKEGERYKVFVVIDNSDLPKMRIARIGWEKSGSPDDRKRRHSRT